MYKHIFTFEHTDLIAELNAALHCLINANKQANQRDVLTWVFADPTGISDYECLVLYLSPSVQVWFIREKFLVSLSHPKLQPFTFYTHNTRLRDNTVLSVVHLMQEIKTALGVYTLFRRPRMEERNSKQEFRLLRTPFFIFHCSSSSGIAYLNCFFTHHLPYATCTQTL